MKMVVDYHNLIRVARKQEYADVVVKNGKIVNVFSGEIYEGGLAIVDDLIAAVGDMDGYVGPNTHVVDAKNGFVAPGLIDGHVHIESSMLSVTRFAELALRHGTTSVMSDLHEVAVVGGLETVLEMLREAEQALLKIYFVIPSHVPFSPGFETTGAIVGPKEVRKALEFPRCVGLSEIVVSSALGEEERLWKAMDIVRGAGKLLHGHGPFTYGSDLAGFAALGIHTDHEAFSLEDGLARLRAGIHLQIRQGSAAESIPELIPLIIEQGLNSENVSVITDDILAEDLAQKGYQDVNIGVLQELGLDAISAIQMVTINAAKAFRLEHEVGVLAPGRQADLVIVDDLKSFIPRTVMARGTLVMDDGDLVFEFPEPKPSYRQLNSINMKVSVKGSTLSSLAKCSPDLDRVSVHVLDTPKEIPVPELKVLELKVRNGSAQPDPQKDIAAIVVAERHHATGNISLSFTRGFGLKKGAIASSVAHDNHNIIAIGVNYEDLAFAINRVADLKGGQVVVENENVLAEVPLPILGLMSADPVEDVCNGLRKLTAAAREIGCDMRWPHMFMSFMTCSAGPGYSITDKGLLDGYKQEFIPAIITGYPN
jgi:adenine deaminase